MAANHVILNKNQRIASLIMGKLHHQQQQSSLPAFHSIFRIPNVLRSEKGNVYVPHLLSIGPLHRGLNSQIMKEVKLRYLHGLLERFPTPNTVLENFVQAISDIESYCRGCYEGKIHLTSDEFVEMMVVDGCFILELFRKKSGIVPIKYDDPVFHNSWIETALINDLLLVENQLPWKVLAHLLAITGGNIASDYQIPYPLPELIPIYFWRYTLGKCTPVFNEDLECKHILDFIRKSLLGQNVEIETEFQPISWSPIPSVTELAQYGVKFKCREKDDNMLNITFTGGVMEIPPIRVYKNGKSLLRNLIAYEQCDITSVSKFTSYAVLLANLVKSKQDIEKLIEKGIIEYHLGGDISEFFTCRSYDVTFYKFSYARLFREVNKFVESPRNKLIRQLNTYFKNPVELFNFTFAVVVVTILTFIQTVLSLLSYSKHQQ